MQPNWIYCVRQSEAAKTFLDYCIREKTEGRFLGSTFPASWTHTCFTPHQCQEIDAHLKKASRVEFQVCMYYTGDLLDTDFGLKTFKEPLVQWCPTPKFSRTFRQSILPEAPWGLTMEGEVLLNVGLRESIDEEVSGLRRAATDVWGTHDAYAIVSDGLQMEHDCQSGEPLAVDCSGFPEVDILRLENGVILCTARLAVVLKRAWTGFMSAKFQPVRCLHVPKHIGDRNRRAIRVRDAARRALKIREDIRAVEEVLGISFPPEYSDWVVARSGVLPLGWLSPVGGGTSEIVQCFRQEHEESEPPMPDDLVPIYGYGDGDYVCVDLTHGGLGRWDHAAGALEQLDLTRGFRAFLEGFAD